MQELTEGKLHTGFLRSVKEYAENTCIYINNQSYTYVQVYELAKSIEKQLLPDSIGFIGVHCTHDVWTYAAIIAVLMKGMAYCPIPDEWPNERKIEVIKAANIKQVLSREKFFLEYAISEQNSSVAEDFAYLLFTSGSTGVPKGVPVKHSQLEGFFMHIHKHYHFGAQDRFLQPYELSFDVSLFSIFAAWNVGASVYVVPKHTSKAIAILETIKKHKLTVSSMVPSVLHFISRYLKELKINSLRFSFFSGDVLNHSLAHAWKEAFPESRIINSYGPTETTIVCTAYEWEDFKSEKESKNDIVPLGFCFEGMEYVLLNEENKGGLITGELCFHGIQCISHYLHHKHEEQFIYLNNKRFYKTGDIVSVDKNGTLHFRGRTDRQLKINGYRVEPAEVEWQIKQITGLNNLSLKNPYKNQLVSFIEGKGEVHALKTELSSKIPAYMLPEQFIFVEEFPKTLHDKFDTNALLNLIETHGD